MHQSNGSNWSKRDAAVNWHPYTQMQLLPEVPTLVHGQGAYLYDEQGHAYIDAVSSWWVNLHGHCHPHLTAAVHAQMLTLDHSIFAGFTHPKAIELSERLLALLPGNQKRIFYSDNGSTAIEVALKMALQYWHQRGEPRRKILYLEGAYHGDTFGAMTSSARSVFTKPFQPLLAGLFDTVSIGVGDLTQLEQHLKQSDVAAFIFEPLVQGAGGFLMHEPEPLSAMLALCKGHGVLTIADEVMTGFGRTGPLFASSLLTPSPDIICLAKGITGGIMPLAVTSCAAFLYESFLSDDREKAFFHGHSYTANAIACAAACASLDLLTSENSKEQRSSLAARFQEAATSFQARSPQGKKLTNVRCRGGIFAANIGASEAHAAHYLATIGPHLARFFFKRGIIIRPLGNVFYVMPPYCIDKAALNQVFNTLEDFLSHEL